MDVVIKSPAKMGKQELTDKLTELGYTSDKLCDEGGYRLKRPELVEILKAHLEGQEGLVALSKISDTPLDDDDDDVGLLIKTVDVEPDTKEIGEEIDPPLPSDPGWTQYVLGKFLPDEVDGPNPRVEGLRRIAGELVGVLVEEGCDLIAPPTEDNRFRACVKAWGVFITPEGIQKRFEALADAHSENCLEDYATYLVAMADTRAKGRMYRNALGLRRVVAAEEVSRTMASIDDVQPGGKVHASQVTMLRMISDRHNFSIQEVLDTLEIKYKLNEQTGDVNLQSLSYEDALSAATHMREMRENRVNE
jgi:hypothetical protein